MIPRMSDQGERELIWKGAKFDFERVRLVSPTGKVLRREVVRHPGAVCILPLLESPGVTPRIVMIRNTRVALGRALWELPAGTMEPPEPAEACAARELIEEAGYQASSIIPIGAFFTTPGMTDEWMRAFLARGLALVGAHLEEDERIEAHPLTIGEVFAMLDHGELMDAKSMLTLMLAQRQGLLPGFPPCDTPGQETGAGESGGVCP